MAGRLTATAGANVKRTVGIVAVVALSALSLAACGQKDDTAGNGGNTGSSSPSAKSIDFKACMVSDSGGFDDKSFNQTSLKGLTEAKDQLGIQTGQVESSANADYAKNIQSMVDANCNMIVTV